jgi:indolepyruvate ferredoxin oxidoreductase beta subunit
MSCDVVLVGVGGQGVLTIGDLLLRAAFAADVPASFCPTKGMAQRGGFVKVEVRLGREGVGPRIGDKTADLVVSMERSEALKGIRYAKPGGTFILFDQVWEPTGVMLGDDPYPTLEQVAEEIRDGVERLIVLDPADLPTVDGRPVQPNVYVLGAMLGVLRLAELLDAGTVERILAERWPKSGSSNLEAFRAGLKTSALEIDR